jgi:hypothetical protein
MVYGPAILAAHLACYPDGYMRNSSHIKKNRQEAGIVRLIFSLQTEKKNGQQITDYLNERGYRRRNGTEWTQRQVWAILNRQGLYRRVIIKYGEVKAENKDLIIF